MNFKEFMLLAKENDSSAISTILNMYRPLLLKQSIDEDLYQELCLTLLNCIKKFRV